jgi:hypothetical protein
MSISLFQVPGGNACATAGKFCRRRTGAVRPSRVQLRIEYVLYLGDFRRFRTAPGFRRHRDTPKRMKRDMVDANRVPASRRSREPAIVVETAAR